MSQIFGVSVSPRKYNVEYNEGRMDKVIGSTHKGDNFSDLPININ